MYIILEIILRMFQSKTYNIELCKRISVITKYRKIVPLDSGNNALRLFIFFFQIGGITMRRINRRLVLLLIVLVCDVVSVLGRPQEQITASSQLKGNC